MNNHSYGVKVFKCGDMHEGWYVQDVRHGRGVYVWANGDRYDGAWANGKVSRYTSTSSDDVINILFKRCTGRGLSSGE